MAKYESGTIGLVFAAKAQPDGSLCKSSNSKPPELNSARKYDSLPVRFWDRYVNPEHNALWHTTLHMVATNGTDPTHSKARKMPSYWLSELEPVNILKGTGLVSPMLSIMDNSDDFDVSRTGVAFLAQDPTKDSSKHYGNNVYWTATGWDGAPGAIETPSFDGACESLVISPNGRSLAFVKTKSGELWYGHQHIFVIEDVRTEPKVAVEVLQNPWSLSPYLLRWGLNEDTLYAVAEDRGHNKLFRLSSKRALNTTKPLMLECDRSCCLDEDPSVLDIRLFSTTGSRDLVHVTTSSFVDSSSYCVVDPTEATELEIFCGVGDDCNTFKIFPHQIWDMWWDGEGDHMVHAFAIRPSSFSKAKKYPVAILLHGGPVSSWKDLWMSRWNPMIFAEAGYIVILPNITGSTGYGRDCMESIKGEFLGRPFRDLERLMDHLAVMCPHADLSRAVALGASYGGIMINWIAGQPLAKKFKALVNHDGFLHLTSLYGCDIMDQEYDFGGPLWDNRGNYEKYDPSRFVGNWTTPMLFINGELDYRCPVTEGLAAFTICQRRGIESQFLHFRDENHWVLKPENQLVWYNTVLEWIMKFTGVEPVDMNGEVCLTHR